MLKNLLIPSDAVRRRRAFFSVYFALLFGFGLVPMLLQLNSEGWTFLRALLLLLYIPLLAQIVYGFAIVTTGFFLLNRGGDQLRINQLVPVDEIKDLPATAIVMPIYNENVDQVFQRIRVMFDSLRKTDAGKNFDFFVLSDSNDPNHWIAEENAWLELCKQTEGFGRIFYRKRRVCTHNKSGNIADFCRRWGASYRYMIVLDADSLMTGPTFVRLARLMEHDRQIGIIQTSPQLALGKTLFQRLLQFGTQLCGPMFSAGANYWQLGHGNFWGHNAIIRLQPFIKYCAIPELPASSPFGRRILSHDTIEAALMLRAGFSVWYAYDLEGGYEESPPNLLETLARDRRWCFGNMQHLYFLFARGVRPLSRFHLLNGIMAYASSLLWLTFLLVSTILAFQQSAPRDLGGFFQKGAGPMLLVYIITMLFLPKILGAIRILQLRLHPAMGGAGMVILSVLAEMVFSMLMAPILMLFHAQFVIAALLGSKVSWGAQIRGADDRVTWRPAFRMFGPPALAVLAWMGLVLWLKPAFLAWMMLVFIGPLVAIPFAVLTGSAAFGRSARQLGWFLVPDETRPNEELRQMEEHVPASSPAFFRTQKYAHEYGLLQVILDPYINAIHVSMLRQRHKVSIHARAHVHSLAQKILRLGPASLNDREKRRLLWDADAMTDLHRRLWGSPAAVLDQWWQDALRHYNDASAFGARKIITRG
jgi:membrane glycosyltransferase